MSNTLNKLEFVELIMSYLQNRLEINDAIRFRDNDSFLTVDEVYNNYLKGVEEGYATNLSFLSNYYRCKNGRVVKFDFHEIFDIVRKFLTEKDIGDYPSYRGDECGFIISILKEILKNYSFMLEFDDDREKLSIFKEMQEKYNKYIVALNCLKTYLSFYNDIEGFIVKNTKEFYIDDHKHQRFIECSLGNTKMENYTKVVLSDDVYVAKVMNKDTGEEELILLENNQTDENIISVKKLHDFLEENDCLFLESDVYDLDELNTSLKDKIVKYINMSEEEREKLEKLSEEATNWWMKALKTVYFCTSEDLKRAASLGCLSIPDIEEYQNEEELFYEYLKGSIKELILLEDVVRIIADSFYHGVFKKAYNKTKFHFKPLYRDLSYKDGAFTYEDNEGNRVKLDFEIPSEFVGIFSMHNFYAKPIHNEMYIYDGDVLFTDQKHDRVLIYSTKRDYKLSRKPIDIK